MKQRITLFDTTLRDGQQTASPCPQAQPRTGKENKSRDIGKF